MHIACISWLHITFIQGIFLSGGNTEMDIEEIVCGGVDWIQVAQHRVQYRALVRTIMNLQILRKTGNILNS